MADILGNANTTASISVGNTVSGTLETAGDHDWYRINLTAGQQITVTLNGVTLEDPYLYVRNSAGTVLTENDDINDGVVRDSRTNFTASSTGTYYIDASAWVDIDHTSPGYTGTGTYQLAVSTYTQPPLYTNDQIADQLISGYWAGDVHHFNVTQGGTLTFNVTALGTGAEKTLAREALNMWSDAIGVTFKEVTSGGQISFTDNESGAFTEDNYSGGITSSAHVNIEAQWVIDYGSDLNSYSFQSYLHEIGHALGLGHAGNYNGDATYSTDALYRNDAWSTSIMSYFSQLDNTYFKGQGFTENYVVSPMSADIVAMQELYGLSTTTRAGNTVYGYHSTANRAVFDATQFPDAAFTVIDSGGTDTLDYSGWGGNQVINLNAETFSSVNGSRGNVSIARGNVIENAIGGAGNDTLTGNGAANILTGNAGDDHLVGGAGADRMSGGAGDDVYSVDSTGDIVIEGAGGGDDLVQSTITYTAAANIERVTLTGNAAVAATGNALINTIVGNGAANTLSGDDGNDVLKGMAGNDRLNGGSGADKMIGGTGNDVYFVNQGGETVSENAGEGTDTVKSSVSYTLGNNVENLTLTGSAATNGTGNDAANAIAGNAAANTLSGAAGNDELKGLGGNDTLLGGDGADKIYGGAGTDHMTGGSGADLFVFDDADFGGKTASSADEIIDFTHADGDRIHLKAVDANSALSGDQAFAFIGQNAFHHSAGELRYEQSGGNTFLYGDTNGDGSADFAIKLDGLHTLTNSDLVL